MGFGAERPWFVVNLRGTRNAEVACLEITDHSECVEFHSGRLACARDKPPYGDWAASGILAVDSSHVTLRSLDIHGLASAGIVAGRISDWLIEDVFITANGLVGWQGDLGEPSSNSGRIVFRRVTIDWNGCGETLQRQPIGCWAQEAGGYGDGLGTAATGGDWVFEDSRFIANTSDGLDLLYHDGKGTITIDRVWAEANAGNQLKARGEVTIRDSVAVGNCDFFRGKPQSFKVDDCRAQGNTIALMPIAGRPQRVERSTVTGAGNSLIEVVAPTCGRFAPVTLAESIWLGGTFAPSGEPTAFLYKECGGLEGSGPPIEHVGNVIFGVKDYGFGPEGACPTATGNVCADPRLDPTTLRPRPGSPAQGKGAKF
jgi:hypothetical protein